MRVHISSDTTALVEAGMFNKYDISVFPLNVIVDGEEFLDGVTIDQPTLCQAMRGGKNIKTSTPPLGGIIEYFEKVFAEGYDQVIHFTISSKLSSMYNLFCTVAEQNFPGKLFIVDGYAVSTIMAAHVFYAYEEVNKGTPVEEVLKVIEERKKESTVVFIPENLTALKRGGRISPAIALIGNMLGIKPVLSLKDGQLEKEGTTKQVRRTIIDSVAAFKDKYPTDKFDYTIVNFDGKPEVLEYIHKAVAEILGEGVAVSGVLPINVCAHCGPGTVGVVVSQKINGKSIKEFL